MSSTIKSSVLRSSHGPSTIRLFQECDGVSRCTSVMPLLDSRGADMVGIVLTVVQNGALLWNKTIINDFGPVARCGYRSIGYDKDMQLGDPGSYLHILFTSAQIAKYTPSGQYAEVVEMTSQTYNHIKVMFTETELGPQVVHEVSTGLSVNDVLAKLPSQTDVATGVSNFWLEKFTL